MFFFGSSLSPEYFMSQVPPHTLTPEQETNRQLKSALAVSGNEIRPSPTGERHANGVFG
jgi:hypothetical protein